LKVEVIESEFNMNHKNGVFVEQFWKGPLVFSRCKFTNNADNGLCAVSIDYPSVLAGGSTTTQAAANTNLSTLSSNSSKNSSNKIAPVPLIPQELGIIKIIDSSFTENKKSGLMFNKVIVHVSNSQFWDNTSYAIYVPEDSQKFLLRISRNEVKKLIKGDIGGPWGSMGTMHMVGNKSAFASCCGLRGAP
jgi:hypothetical protein